VDIGPREERKLGLALPNVEVGTTYGSPAMKVGGKMFACIADHRAGARREAKARLGLRRRYWVSFA
jgi:hypothetical protein